MSNNTNKKDINLITELNDCCHDFLYDNVAKDNVVNDDLQYYVDELLYECDDVENTKFIIIESLEKMIKKVKEY